MTPPTEQPPSLAVYTRDALFGPDGPAPRIIGRWARRLVEFWRVFHDQDRDDLEQRLALDLLCRWPAAGAGGGLAATIVKHRALEYARMGVRQFYDGREYARSRERQRQLRSLDQIAGDDGGPSPSHSLTAEHCRLRRRSGGRSEAERVDLALDLAAAVDSLPDDDRGLCEQLKVQDPPVDRPAAGRDPGTPAARIRKIRDRLSRGGLAAYDPQRAA